METKRGLYAGLVDLLVELGEMPPHHKHMRMEEYDATQDDSPMASPDRPNVHEIAAMLLASLWQSDDEHTSIDDCYRAAQALYDVGTEWEKKGE